MVHAEEMWKKHPIETVKYFLKPHKIPKDERQILDEAASHIRKVEQDIELYGFDHHNITPDMEKQFEVALPLLIKWIETYGRPEQTKKGLDEVVP